MFILCMYIKLVRYLDCYSLVRAVSINAGASCSQFRCQGRLTEMLQAPLQISKVNFPVAQDTF